MKPLAYSDLLAWGGFPATVRPSTVRKWLESQGIPYGVTPDGKPVTTLTQIDAALSGANLSVGPNWSALDEAARKGTRKERQVLLRPSETVERANAGRGR